MTALVCPECGWLFRDDRSGVVPEHGDSRIGYLAMLCPGSDAPALSQREWRDRARPDGSLSGALPNPLVGDGSLFHDSVGERADAWEQFVLLRTVVEQSSSSLVAEAMIVLERLEADIARLREAEALGDA